MNTPLHELTAARKARFRDDHGWQVPDHYGAWEEEYRALREGAGLLDLSNRGKIAVSGDDRVRWLHGMVSNDVKGLAAGQGNYCFVLNTQGHILADAQILVETDRILMDCEPFLTQKLIPILDHFIIMDQVELADVTAELGAIGVEGPRAAEFVESVPWENVRTLRVERGLWLLAPHAKLGEIWERLEAAGARPAGRKASDTVRIEAGTPRYGADMDESTLALETGQTRAIHFNKGCYIGQEIVERVRSRGHVNRLLTGLKSALPLAPDSRIEAEGQQAGRVTSSAYSPALKCTIALAYLRREFSQPGTKVTAAGQAAEVSALPF